MLCGLIGSAFGVGLGLLMAHNVNEIERFVNVVSREMNRMKRGELVASASVLFGAGAAVIWNWLVLYKAPRRHPWVRIAAALAALGAAAWFSTDWDRGEKGLRVAIINGGPGLRGRPRRG